MRKIVGLLMLLAAPASAADPPLLANQFGELCTMCEAALRCEPTATGVHTVYVFHKKGFIGQMMTVLDYVPFIGPPLWEERPVTAIALGASPTRNAATARLSLKENGIEVAGATIDRTTGAWRTADGAAGTCKIIDKADVAALSAGGSN